MSVCGLRSVSCAGVALASTLSMLVGAPAYAADTALSVCFNYGCQHQAEVRLSAAELAQVKQHFAEVHTAEDERAAIAVATGALYRIAGAQAPIYVDRGGNYADDALHGRMDCIDHATTTTRWLELMAAQGWLQHHDVVQTARRSRFWMFEHYSAVIVERAALAAAEVEETPVPAELARTQWAAAPYPDVVGVAPPVVKAAAYPGHYVVDSWFVDHAEPAVILPLADWMKGEGPDVR